MTALRTVFVLGLAVVELALLAWPFGAVAQVARVSTSNGTIMPDARTIFIESASLPGEGMIVVRAQTGADIAPASLGQLRVPAGESANLRVRLRRPPAEGQALVVMLHADYGRPGVYDRTDPVVLSVDVPRPVVRAALARR